MLLLLGLGRYYGGGGERSAAVCTSSNSFCRSSSSMRSFSRRRRSLSSFMRSISRSLLELKRSHLKRCRSIWKARCWYATRCSTSSAAFLLSHCRCCCSPPLDTAIISERSCCMELDDDNVSECGGDADIWEEALLSLLVPAVNPLLSSSSSPSSGAYGRDPPCRRVLLLLLFLVIVLVLLAVHVVVIVRLFRHALFFSGGSSSSAISGNLGRGRCGRRWVVEADLLLLIWRMWWRYLRRGRGSAGGGSSGVVKRCLELRSLRASSLALGERLSMVSRSVWFSTTRQAVPVPRRSFTRLYRLLRSLNLSSHCCGDTQKPFSIMARDTDFHFPFFCNKADAAAAAAADFLPLASAPWACCSPSPPAPPSSPTRYTTLMRSRTMLSVHFIRCHGEGDGDGCDTPPRRACSSTSSPYPASSSELMAGCCCFPRTAWPNACTRILDHQYTAGLPSQKELRLTQHRDFYVAAAIPNPRDRIN
ncbi:hypothetical protein C4D60_Mb02t20930 [Musa balbisiana]|uniref:Uncharacterized protein n=1 Tax=Musa balbisiana TaxID=52838 RepID=A0A4S8IC84_MUSBA|nr:hypothetical protein C4D60_Mb02t20930 [Musa balbisiana]